MTERNPPRVEILGGDGLHKRTRTWYEREEGFQRLFDRMREGFFWDRLKDIKTQCDDILRERGYAPGEYPSDGNAEPYTDAWYAGNVGWRCDLVLRSHELGEPMNEVLLAYVMAIGELTTEWKWRFTYRPSILTGAKQRKHLKALGDTKNAVASAGVQKRRRVVRELLRETKRKGGALDQWLLRQLAEQHGIVVSERTIRADRQALRGQPTKKLGKPC